MTPDLPPVLVVGVGADGLDALAPAVRRRVLDAPAVVGGARHLAMLPPGPDPGPDAGAAQVRRAWPSPFSLDVVEELRAAHGAVVVLASGDPMVSGVGSSLVARLGAAAVEVVPHVSSVALARARMGWAAESCAVLTVVGRYVETVLRELAPGRRVLVLGSDGSTPAALGALLTEHGWGASTVSVLGDLGTPAESRAVSPADRVAARSPALGVVAIECAAAPTGWAGSWAVGLPDDVFEHDGQLTKRDLRASALARLQPRPGQLLWDVGAGAGSVGVEWMRAHPTCRAVAVEQAEERAQRVGRNARRLGVPGLVVVRGRAPEALVDLPAPDAVFVGGGATVPGVVEACLGALGPGGRLVVHGVTVETEVLVARLQAEHGGELTRHAVETAAPIGSFTGFAPARSVTQWALEVGA